MTVCRFDSLNLTGRNGLVKLINEMMAIANGNGVAKKKAAEAAWELGDGLLGQAFDFNVDLGTAVWSQAIDKSFAGNTFAFDDRLAFTA